MCVRSHQPLLSYEGKSSSEFHRKFLQVVDDCRCQLFFWESVVLLEARELCHDGATDVPIGFYHGLVVGSVGLLPSMLNDGAYIGIQGIVA